MSVFDKKWRDGREEEGKQLFRQAADTFYRTKTYTLYKEERVWDEDGVAR